MSFSPKNKLHSLRALVLKLRRDQRRGKKIVFTNGCFDILHLGHVRYLSKARALGDVLFAISTSGNSKNVMKAVRRAKELGIYTIGFTGGSGGELKDAADLPIVIPSKKTSRIQESHIMIGHILCECVDELLS